MTSAKIDFQGESFDMIQEETVAGVKLYPHQRISVYDMENVERNMYVSFNDGDNIIKTRTAIFGDHPGYGKTYSMCALIKRDNVELDLEKFIPSEKYVNGLVKLGKIYRGNVRIPTTLIILPLGIVNQWTHVLSLFGLNYIVINKKKMIPNLQADIYDVIVVSSTMYSDFYEKTIQDGIVFRRVIFDEPDSTKVRNFYELPYMFRWFVTGTPLRLVSTRQGIRNLPHQINAWVCKCGIGRDNIDLYTIFNDIDLIKSSVRLPDIETKTYSIVYSRMQNLAMRHVTDHNVREAIANGKIDEAVKLMGWNSEGDITECIVEGYKERIAILEHEAKGIELRLARGERTYFRTRLEEVNQRINTLKQYINDVNEEKQKILDADCTICLDKCDIPVMTKCCNSVTCRNCLLQWLQSSYHKNCHMCRKIITPDMVLKLTNNCEEKAEEIEVKQQEENKPLSKKATIEKILKEGGENKRWIIFASSKYSFESLGSSILDRYKYEELKGSTSAINNVIKRFEKGVTQIILVNNDHNCAGINILCATDVIIHDATSNMQELQCIKRAHRMGRTEPLTVHRFVEENKKIFRI